MHKVYIGWDPREVRAWNTAAASIHAKASAPTSITPLKLDRLEAQGLLRRPHETIHGQLYDVLSDAPMATEFAISRFLTPLLAQEGWALFMDCDMLVLADIAELFRLVDDRYAVMCVKHDHQPAETVKMDAQIQTAYPRKNWSSVLLFNCEHPANRALTLTVLNTRPGRDLHRFCWLRDEEIGALPSEWNWLVGVQPKPAAPKIAHFTLGGPYLPGWRPAEHDDLWLHAASNLGT